MSFIFSCQPAPKRQPRLLEVEVLEDRLPLSASPLQAAVLLLLPPDGPPARVAPFSVTTPTGNFVIPPSQSALGPNNNTALGIVLGPTELPAPPLGASPTILNQFGVISPFPGATATVPPTVSQSASAIPSVGLIQQSAPDGAPTLDPTRQISGIDSTVFDPRAGDRIRLRDQRIIRGLGDESDLLLVPPTPQPSTPRPDSSSQPPAASQ
jgi:hypothetical protein